jgi:hypothetical protein
LRLCTGLASGTPRRPRRLFDCHAFGEIARLIDVAAAEDGYVVGEELQRDRRDDRLQKLFDRWNDDHVIGDIGNAVIGL